MSGSGLLPCKLAPVPHFTSLDQIQCRWVADDIEKLDRLKKAGSISDADLRLRAQSVQ
jgi:hypothetical protein